MVSPDGYTDAFAAPEVLARAVTLADSEDDTDLLDGPAVDMWSVGIVLYYLWTGTFPFTCEAVSESEIHSQLTDVSGRKRWTEASGTLQGMSSWVCNMSSQLADITV